VENRKREKRDRGKKKTNCMSRIKGNRERKKDKIFSKVNLEQSK